MATTQHAPRTATGTSQTVFTAIIGIASVVVLLQAVWAGLFIHERQDYTARWVDVHARGADLAIVLVIIATVLALVKLRARMDLVIGSAVFAVLLVVEAYIGGLIGAHSKLTVVHFPLGMALMALSVWLPMRATRRVA